MLPSLVAALAFPALSITPMPPSIADVLALALPPSFTPLATCSCRPRECAAEIAHVLLLAYGLPLLLLPSGRSNRAKAGPRLSSSPSDCSYSPIPHPTSLSASSPCSSIPPEALLYTGQLPTCAFVDTGEKSLPENTGNGREGECRDEVSGLCSYTAQGS